MVAGGVRRRVGAVAQRRLWQAAAGTRGAYGRQLWLAVLGVLYGTGARRHEVVELDVEDWDRREGVLSLNGRKTGRERRLPVPELTARCLEAYLAMRAEHLGAAGGNGEAALFVNRWGDRLSEGAVSRGLRRLRERAEVEGVTLHWFRHTCASDLLEDGATLPEVQRYLGHRCIGSTMRYVHVADPQRQRAAEVHPINAMLREEAARG
jgi:site-specific recombinase XerD